MRLDGETQFRTIGNADGTPGGQRVEDHGKSVVANLRAAGEGVVPSITLFALGMAFGFGGGLKGLIRAMEPGPDGELPVVVETVVADMVRAAMVPKDIVDAALHGALCGAEKLR